MQLFHTTNQDNIDSINSEGLTPLSYWTNDEDILSYYMETIEEEKPGARAVVLVLEIKDALAACSSENEEPQPDYPGIEEPITSAIGKKEQEIHADWQASNQTWQESLEIVKSFRLPVRISPELLCVSKNDDELVSLNEFAVSLSQKKKRQMP